MVWNIDKHQAWPKEVCFNLTVLHYHETKIEAKITITSPSPLHLTGLDFQISKDDAQAASTVHQV